MVLLSISETIMIKCEICQKEMNVVNFFHLRKHGITCEEYSKKFPNSPMASPEMCEKRGAKNRGKKRSEETRKKLSKSIKESWIKNPNIGRTGSPLSEESKKIVSEKLMGHDVSEETRKKIGESGIGREPWNKGLTKEKDERIMEVSKKVSEWNKTFLTPEIRNKISQTLKKKYAEGMKIPNAKNGIRKDLGISFRSSWESNYARILLSRSIPISYEEDKFAVYKDNGEIDFVYTPDFRIKENKIYIELKGHANSSKDWNCNCQRCVRDKNKMKKFKENYPDIFTIIIGKKEYAKIYKKYSSIIKNWEVNSTDESRSNNL